MMKAYVLMTSLALMAGTAFGYWNGKGSAQSSFAADCADTSFAVVYDYSSEQHRHFHCFELDASGKPEPASDTLPEGALVL